MSLGDGHGWNNNSPTGSSDVSQGCVEILDLRLGLLNRLKKEHVEPTAGTGDYPGGEHLPGSAVAYVDVADPLYKPEQADDDNDVDDVALDSTDVGRLAVVQKTGAVTTFLKFLDSSATWKILSGTAYMGSLTVNGAVQTVLTGVTPALVVLIGEGGKAAIIRPQTTTGIAFDGTTISSLGTCAGNSFNVDTSKFTSPTSLFYIAFFNAGS